jgi:glutamate-1-semialdehyde 2,1-aminomutase
MNIESSRRAFERAKRYLPGGVNSPVRAFRAVGGAPVFVRRGEGAWIEDLDGNRYVDYVGAWGPLILGHAHPAVVRALQERLLAGTSFGIPTEIETALAETVMASLPSLGRVRFVNSGTEATMSAIRLARGFTKRPKVVKFAGCYHGHSDALLVKAGSGAATFGTPDSEGVPESFTRETIVLPFNDLPAAEAAMKEVGREVAAVILEPVVGNMGVVPPVAGFLEGLCEITQRHGSLLIFDEVMTGFRLGMGGAQGLYGVTPDLTCLGKVVGGGLPVGAFGGRQEIMGLLSPEGPVYQAGTLSGNPLAMQAGLTTLEEIGKPGFFESLARNAERLVGGLRGAARDAGVPVQVQSVGSMFTVFFTGEPVRDFASADRCDRSRFALFHQGMLSRGVYWPPSQLEACFVSGAHGQGEIDRTVEAAREVFVSLTK